MPLYIPPSSSGSSPSAPIVVAGILFRPLVDTSTGDTVVSLQVQINGVWITVASVTNP